MDGNEGILLPGDVYNSCSVSSHGDNVPFTPGVCGTALHHVTVVTRGQQGLQHRTQTPVVGHHKEALLTSGKRNLKKTKKFRFKPLHSCVFGVCI